MSMDWMWCHENPRQAADEIERLRAAVAAEREACKQIADQVQKNMGEECDFGAGMVSKLIAARGTK